MPVVLLGVFAALCWSVHDLFARSLAVRIGPFRMAMLVMLAGGLLLTGFVISDGTVWTASRSALLLSVGLGIAYGVGVGGLFKAFSLGPVSIVAPLTAAYPVLVLLWGFANGLQPTALQWAATGVTVAGAVVMARASGDDNAAHALEKGKLPMLLFFCILASLGYAVAVILGQNAAVAMGEVEAAWISRPVALLSLLPFLAREKAPARMWPRHWIGITVMGTLDVLGLVAVNASGHLPGREFAAIGISAYGAIAAILAMVFLREKVSARQLLGIALIAGGVATLSVSQ